MKQRNEEGYVLVYVMVVVFVLCAIATALITQTIHTMAAQKNMVDRMQDKYVAMGEIERVVAELEATPLNITSRSNYTTSQSTAAKDAVTAFRSYLDNTFDPCGPSLSEFSSNLDNFSVSFFIESVFDSVTVRASVLIYPVFDTPSEEIITNQDDIAENPTLNIVPVYETRYSYVVSGAKNTTFVTYEILTNQSTPEGGDPA